MDGLVVWITGIHRTVYSHVQRGIKICGVEGGERSGFSGGRWTSAAAGERAWDAAEVDNMVSGTSHT